jgi:hypothetical protein
MTGPDREKFMDDLTDHELLALAEECGIDMRDNPSRGTLMRAITRVAEERVDAVFRDLWELTWMFESLQDETIRMLRELHGPQRNIELAHAKADDILTWLLTRLGFKRVVEEWQRVDKFYG